MTLDQITRLAELLPVADQRRLVESLTEKLKQAGEAIGNVAVEQPRAPRDLYGIWRDSFPIDIDIDTILDEVRHEWEKEWPEVFRR
jgi:hypothetical protein